MHPETITLNGKTYTVNVDLNSNGEIQYFNLRDVNGEFFYETDWEGPFTEEDVLRLIQEESNQESPAVQSADKAIVGASDISAISDSEIAFFDKCYPHYASYPKDFKEEAITTMNSFVGESMAFKEIWLSEFADYYSEEHGI